MKNQDIDTLFKQTSKSLSELAIVSSENGIHLDNDLDSTLFSLFIDEKHNEMIQFKRRIDIIIARIKNDKIMTTDCFDISKELVKELMFQMIQDEQKAKERLKEKLEKDPDYLDTIEIPKEIKEFLDS